MSKSPLWLHRTGMIVMLPIAVLGAIPLGILYGLAVVCDRFAYHWKDHP